MEIPKINEALSLLAKYSQVCHNIDVISNAKEIKVTFTTDSEHSVIINNLPGVQFGLFGIDAKEPLADIITDRVLAELANEKISLENKIKAL